MNAAFPLAGALRAAGRPVPPRAHGALLAAILLLSAYVHLWNPVGFPDLFFDEGVYMRRAMHVIEEGSPQESHLHDHPYLGQLMLAGFLGAAGFPGSASASAEAPYLAPRILMGLLAVLDTFLVYKIADGRLGRRAAVIAAVLFAAMPITWFLRRITLDALALPLVLSSMLLAMRSGGRGRGRGGGIALLAGSAALLGLAVFTKMTAASMIPVVAYLVVSARGWRALPAWLAPVAAIPSAWPALAAHAGRAGEWLDGILWQAGRHGAGGSFAALTAANFGVDPVVMGLGLAGVAYAAARRRLFLVVWFAPFALLASVTYFQYFHYILALPAMCAAAALLVDDALRRLCRPAALQRAAAAAAAASLAALGAAWSAPLISEDASSAQLEALSYLASAPDGLFPDGGNGTTVLASPVYSWVLSSVHGMPNVAPDYSYVLFYPIETERYVLVADPHLQHDLGRGERLAGAYDRSEPVWAAWGGQGDAPQDRPPRPRAAPAGPAASTGLYVEVRAGPAGPLADAPHS